MRCQNLRLVDWYVKQVFRQKENGFVRLVRNKSWTANKVLTQEQAKPNFGIIFDIDGVLLRGKTAIPSAKDALALIVNRPKNEFNMPCLFCTNGFGLPEVRAKDLSEVFGVTISSQQMVMSQTPLATFKDLHNRWCLICGPDHSGGTIKVAQSIGFKNIITIDDLRKAYPLLDWVDRSRWPHYEVEEVKDFPKIEAVILLGEPIRWETNLQLIIDVLLTNGKPNQALQTSNEDQLPVLAVNMDLQWMAKATTPRFGHGAFLLCLESLYKKICGRDLVYTALMGKPSELTFVYSKESIEQIASQMKLPELKTVYFIGDNPLTDIYGSNVFNQILDRQRQGLQYVGQQEAKAIAEQSSSLHSQRSIKYEINRCVSFLVCTGVYRPQAIKDGELSTTDADLNPLAVPTTLSHYGNQRVDHGHRDLPFTEEMTKPDYVVRDVKTAVEKILELECFSAQHLGTEC